MLSNSGIDGFRIIQNMSIDDAFLCGRSLIKTNKAQLASNPEEFEALMRDEINANGTYFACGLNRAWVTEIFEGLRSQYLEFKFNRDDRTDYLQAGYSSLVGEDIEKLFLSHMHSKNQIIYHLRHTGTEDHDWTIEQLAHQKGYRIYQSYQSAFSQYAWLGHDLHELFLKAHILLPTQQKEQANQMVKQITGNAVSLDNLDDLPEELLTIKPYLIDLRDANESSITTVFSKSRDQYGNGKILTHEEFKNYLKRLASLTSYLKTNDKTQTTFSQLQYDAWADLFGAVNPVHYPNLPNDFLTSVLFAGQDRNYDFQIKIQELSDDDHLNNLSCHKNLQFMVGNQAASNYYH